MLSLNTEADILQKTAEAIRRQRLALNLPQAALATLTGVPLSTLRRLERTGQGGMLTLTTLGMADQFIGALHLTQESATSIKAFIAANGPARQRARRPRDSDHAAL